MPPNTPSSSRLVLEEMTVRRQHLQAAITSIDQFRRRFTDIEATALLVPDTNVLLEHPQELAQADWHSLIADHVRPLYEVRLVIPLLVIDELDNAKRVGRTQSRARGTLKAIYKQFRAAIGMRRLLRQQSEQRGRTYCEILMEAPAHLRLPRPDDELVHTAAQLSDLLERQVVFVTYDTGAALRAAAAGLTHVRLQHTKD